MGRRSTLGSSEGVRFAESPYGAAAAAGAPLRIRLLRLHDRRQPPRHPERQGCRGTRRRHSRRPSLRSRVAPGQRLARRDPRRSGRLRAYSVAARAIVNAAGPWVGDVLQEPARRRERARASPGEGQPHRRAAALRRRPGLCAAARRPAPRVRHSLSRRLHAGRHDRRALLRRARSPPRSSRWKRSTCATP